MPFVIRKASTLIDPLGKLQSCFYCYPKMVAVVWPHHSREAYPSWKRILIWLCTLSANRWKNKCECKVPSTKMLSVNWEENISTIKRLRKVLSSSKRCIFIHLNLFNLPHFPSSFKFHSFRLSFEAFCGFFIYFNHSMPLTTISAGYPLKILVFVSKHHCKGSLKSSFSCYIVPC